MSANPMIVTARKTAALTGLSYRSILDGCKNGTIPHIRVGEGKNARFMILLPKYMEQLNKQAEG